MADLKISQLPAAGTLDGTELVAVVQAGTTDQTTVAAFTAAAAASSTMVAASDIGTAPNEIPLNQYLGSLAYQDGNAVNISGGAINAAVIGGATPAAGTFTTLNTTGDVVFNEAGADVDFRVESDTNTHALFVRGSDGNVGIGTSSPANLLDVAGAITTKSSDTSIYTTGVLTNQKLRLINSSTTDDTSVSLGFRSVNSLGTEFGAAGITAVIANHTSGQETAYLTFSINNNSSFAERLRITSVGNVKVGGSADRATTVGTNHLDIFNGTAPVGTLTNGISIYSSAGEAYVMDAAGNATLFSPHDAETNEWIFRSKHTPTGKVLKIDVERLLRFVNDHFGLDAVQEFIEE